MRIFWDERQRLHAPKVELHNGSFEPYAEHIGRVDSILAAIKVTLQEISKYRATEEGEGPQVVAAKPG